MAAASTVRFAELVKSGGTPEVHLSWLAPAKDPDLQRAQKQHRLVTVHQHARGPRDFGVVGFEPAPDAQFLVFRKSLRTFAGRRVIGIKYEMLTEASDDNVSATAPRESRKAKAGKSAKAPALSPKRPTHAKPTRRAGANAEPEADFITDTDPVKRDVRKALIALSAGRTAEAKRHLQAILANKDER